MPIKKVVIIGQFAVILFMVRSCHLQDLTIDSNGLKIKMYEGQVNQFTKTVNEYGHQLATQDQMIMDRDKDLEKELLRNSQLKSLNEQIKVDSETKIKNIIAGYSGNTPEEKVTFIHDTIIKNGDTTFVTGVPIGTKFNVQDTGKWYSIAGSLQKEGVKFDSVKFKNEMEVNIGLEREKGYKGWLLGKTLPKVEVVTKNPYTDVTGMKNIKFEDKKWWQNGWLKFGAGVLLGGLILGK
jgi:hypothetical protein